MRILRHILLVIVGVLITIGIPFFCTDYGKAILSGKGVDTVTSASTIIDAPGGKYIVLINKKIHAGKNLEDWETYFTGGDIAYIFDDISCGVASSDVGAVEMANSFRSKLPENQMKVLEENSTLLLSRADVGLFDVIILSEEFAEQNRASSAYSDDVAVIEIQGEK